MDLHFAGNGDKNEQIEHLFEQLDGFCKNRNLNLHMSGFTRTLLHCPNEKEFPQGTLQEVLYRKVFTVLFRINFLVLYSFFMYIYIYT